MNLPLPALIGIIIIAIALLYADYRNRLKKVLEANPRYVALKARQDRVHAMGIAINKANALFHRDNAARAINVLEEWLATEPDVEDGDSILVGHGLLGIYYTAVNRMDDAAPLLLQALTFYEKPDNRLTTAAQSAANIHDQLGRYYTIQGDIEAKQAHYRRAAESWDAAGERGCAARARANWHTNSGEPLLAAEKYAEALANPPRYPDPVYRPVLLVQKMIAYFQAGYYSAALAAARDVVAENAAEAAGAGGYRMLALAFGRLDYFAEAEGFLRQATKHDKTPGDVAQTLAARCTVLMYGGRFAEIITLCESYRADSEKNGDPVSGQIMTHYGISLSAVARFDESAQTHRFAVAQYPITDPMSVALMIALSQAALATVELERGNHAETRTLIDAAMPMATTVPYLHHHLPAVRVHSDTLSGQITSDAAELEIQQVRQQTYAAMDAFPNPSDAKRFFLDALIHLARAFVVAGNPAEALQTLEPFASGDALSPGMRSHWHLWRGRAYEASGNVGAARREYESAVTTGEVETRSAKDARRWLAALSSDAPDAVQ